MQLNDMNERNKDNIMNSDCVPISGINHICEQS